jgi:hypothetical protein
MQYVRSFVYLILFVAATAVFGVIVLVSALLPLSIQQRYVIPRAWGLFLTWLAGGLRLRYTVEGRVPPVEPFVALKAPSTWGFRPDVVVPLASRLLKREVV